MIRVPSDELPASLASRLEVLGELGAGGFGRVLEVRDRELGAVRALKLQPVQGDGRREARELQAAAAVVDPHVIRCFDGDVEDGVAWLLMERVLFYRETSNTMLKKPNQP